MENINNNTMNNNNNSNSFSMTEPATTKMHGAETSLPLFYKSAARNLRLHHGVPSMTDGSLQKTMTLLQLRPARLVAQGLASRKLLKGETATPDNTLDGSSSSSGGNSVEEKDTSEVSDSSNANSSTNNSGNSSDDDDNEHRHNLETEDRKRPVHTALAVAGIKLRPRETRPLLLALGVRPHRLVKLGLVEREALLGSRRGACGRSSDGGRGSRHQQHGPPGRRAHRGGEGLGRPRHGPLPHGQGRSPAHLRHGRSSSPIHELGAPLGPFHRAGRHGHQHRGRMQPFGDVPHGSRHHGRPNHTHGPPAGARMPPHHEPAQYHSSGESDGAEGAAMHRGSPGRGPSRGRGGGQHGPLRNHGPPRHHGRPNHGRRPQGGGRHANHGHGYHRGEDVHSSGSKGEDCAGMRRGSGHHGGPRQHGEGKRHHGRHNERHLARDGEDIIGMMHRGPPRGPPGGAGRHHHGSAGHHDRGSFAGRRHQHHHRSASAGTMHGSGGSLRRLFREQDDDDDTFIHQHLHQHARRMAALPAHRHPCRQLPPPPPPPMMQAC